MVLDKYVELEISGKVHKMCYPIKMVFEAERHLTDGNLMVMVSKAASGIPPTVYDMFIIIKYALMGGDPKLTEAEAEELYLDAVSEKTLVEVSGLAMEALKKSGVLGQEKKAPAAPKA
jgi:hypothetical protein